MTNRYEETYRRSLATPETFWMEAAGLVDWIEKPRRARGGSGWFEGATLNTCYNAVDRHVAAGRGADIALVYDSPVTGTIRRFSFAELQEEVACTAGMLAGLGLGKGDRAILYMPMIPETVFAMLACARLGAIHSVVFGGFAAPELAKRIDDAKPKLLLTASCGIEGQRIVAYKPLVDLALDLARHQPDHVLLFQRPQSPAALRPGRDLDWAALRSEAGPADCVAVAATDPLYILYTSGTTGVPKGVVRDHGGHAVALAWSLPNIYGARAGDTFWAASDVGWVVGHSYIVYGPLIAGCATLLYEGKPVGTPDAGAFWRTIARHGVDIFFTAPTAIRAIRREDPEGALLREAGTGALRAMFLAGERADPDTMVWAERILGLPVIDHWWQTELGWPAVATCIGLGDRRRRAGSAGFPVPGYSLSVLDDAGEKVAAGETGNIVLETPMPPGCYATLWNDEAGFGRAFKSYPGYYETGDAGHIDADGFVHIMGRTDDLINVAGHRLSTGQMEQIIAAHPDVAECAVVAVPDPIKGVAPIAFAVMNGGRSDEASAELPRRLVERVRSELGPVAALRQVHLVRALPKTRSGKILRASLRRLASGEKHPPPATIEDPEVLREIEGLFARSP